MCEEAMETSGDGDGGGGGGAWSCLACGVAFASSGEQRAHYKEDWHRYNLKRRVASVAAVTRDEFQRRANAAAAKEAEAASDAGAEVRCHACRKSFLSANALQCHLQSRRHRRAPATPAPEPPPPPQPEASASTSGPFTRVVAKGQGADTDSSTDVATDSDTEELDSEEWETWEDEEPAVRAALARRCLFCPHGSRSLPRNLAHMEAAHSFFIPDMEYCVDVLGLLTHLRHKITLGFMCIWCGESGRMFRSALAARAHMASSGHCRPRVEEATRAEYRPFYDYSASYPPELDGDGDGDGEAPLPLVLSGGGWALRLPRGARLGHRELRRYFRQHLRPSQSSALQASLARARAAAAPSLSAAAIRSQQRAFHRQSRAALRLALRANKFQTHYRPQVNF